MASSSSKPKRVGFSVKQGDTFRRMVTFQTKPTDTVPDPVPISQAGAVFSFIIEGEADLTLGSGLTIQGAGNNQVLISTPIAWEGSRKYEFQRVLSGITRTFFAGKIKSVAEIIL